jgi:hypothetical protein
MKQIRDKKGRFISRSEIEDKMWQRRHKYFMLIAWVVFLSAITWAIFYKNEIRIHHN